MNLEEIKNNNKENRAIQAIIDCLNHGIAINNTAVLTKFILKAYENGKHRRPGYVKRVAKQNIRHVKRLLAKKSYLNF